MYSLPKTVIRQRRHCDLNPGPSAPESSTLTTWLPSHRLSFSLKNSFSATLFVLFVVPRARLNWLTVSFCAHVNAIFIHSFFVYIPFYFTATQAQHENTAYCVVRSSVVCLCVCLCQSPAKTGKPIEMPLAMWTRWGSKELRITSRRRPVPLTGRCTFEGLTYRDVRARGRYDQSNSQVTRSGAPCSLDSVTMATCLKCICRVRQT